MAGREQGTAEEVEVPQISDDTRTLCTIVSSWPVEEVVLLLIVRFRAAAEGIPAEFQALIPVVLVTTEEVEAVNGTAVTQMTAVQMTRGTLLCAAALVLVRLDTGAVDAIPLELVVGAVGMEVRELTLQAEEVVLPSLPCKLSHIPTHKTVPMDTPCFLTRPRHPPRRRQLELRCRSRLQAIRCFSVCRPGPCR